MLAASATVIAVRIPTTLVRRDNYCDRTDAPHLPVTSSSCLARHRQPSATRLGCRVTKSLRSQSAQAIEHRWSVERDRCQQTTYPRQRRPAAMSVLVDPKPSPEIAGLPRDRDLISCNATGLYQRCPLAYRLEYVDRMPETPVSASLVCMAAIHSAIELWLHPFMAGNLPPDLDTLLHVGQDAWLVAPRAGRICHACKLRQPRFYQRLIQNRKAN